MVGWYPSLFWHYWLSFILNVCSLVWLHFCWVCLVNIFDNDVVVGNVKDSLEMLQESLSQCSSTLGVISITCHDANSASSFTNRILSILFWLENRLFAFDIDCEWLQILDRFLAWLVWFMVKHCFVLFRLFVVKFEWRINGIVGGVFWEIFHEVFEFHWMNLDVREICVNKCWLWDVVIL